MQALLSLCFPLFHDLLKIEAAKSKLLKFLEKFVNLTNKTIVKILRSADDEPSTFGYPAAQSDHCCGGRVALAFVDTVANYRKIDRQRSF